MESRSKYHGQTVSEHTVETIDGCQGVIRQSTNLLNKGHEMGPLATKIACNDKSDEDATYYAIHISSESQLIKEEPHVYLDKKKALDFARKHNKARFKIFKTMQEAVTFSLHGPEVSSSSPSQHLDNTDSNPMIGEKPSLFKGPKSQDLVNLRKAIECGDMEMVKSTVWKNPRYLVSSGDTPAILQEGCRYNALHVAAKARNAQMCEFIIQTVGDPAFFSLLYGDDENACQERAAIMLDLYLNTPDKGLNETPLHFAVKFGAASVVEVLVACPQCDKQPKNKFGITPREMICSRVPSADSKLKKEILDLLEEHYFVPVWRSEDKSVQPIVGAPFQPSSPPVLNVDPLSPKLEIHAFAGPMNSEEAMVFRKKWKTPPRIPHINFSLSSAMRLRDTEKGLERVGRSLAQEFKVSWREYWPFLDGFADLSTSEGLHLLELYLKDRYMEAHCYHSANREEKKEDIMNVSCSSKSSEAGDGAISPISELCRAFKACNLSDTCALGREPLEAVCVKSEKSMQHDVRGGDACVDTDSETLINVLSNPALSPLLYVEKSCQVFSKRIADYLIYMVENLHDILTSESVSDMLSVEIRHLQVLVNSYSNDSRFMSVDFHFVHSRISTIVACKLSQHPNVDMELLADGLKSLLLLLKTLDTCSSDEDEAAHDGMYRHRYNRQQKRTDISVQIQVQCIAQQILDSMYKFKKNCDEKHPDPEARVDSEADCERVWSQAVKCSCLWQTHNFTKGSRKSASFKRSHSVKNESNIYDDSLSNRISRRLSFGESCGSADDETRSRGGLDTNENATWFETRLRRQNSRTQKGGEEFGQVSDSDDGDSFCTASSSPKDTLSEEEMLSADEGISIYIEGDTPSKMDLSVMQAIEGCDIPPEKYPNVFWWRSLVLCHTTEERNSWGTPSNMQKKKTQASSASGSQCSSSCTCKKKREFSSPQAWHRIAGRYAPGRHAY